MPYGLRMVRAWGLGLILTFFWLVPALMLFNRRVILAEGQGLEWLSAADLGSLWQTFPLLILFATLLVLPKTMVMRPGRRGMRLMMTAALIAATCLLILPGNLGLGSYSSGTSLDNWWYKAKRLCVGHGNDWDHEVYTDNSTAPLYHVSIYEDGEGELVRRTEYRDGDFEEQPVSKTPRLDVLRNLVSVGQVYAVIGLPALGLLWISPLLVYHTEKIKENPILRRWFLGGRGGTARWAGPRTLARHADKGKQSILMGASIFDDDFGTRTVSIDDQTHLLTVGSPGSGKSVTCAWPNLQRYSGSAIVIDPKGEHARMTLGYRQGGSGKKGGTETDGITRVPSTRRLLDGMAWVLDPFGVVGCYPSACYNVLSEIDIDDHYARTMISVISKSCITVSGGDNKFWEECARAVLDGAIAHVLSTYSKDKHTLPHVADMLLGLDSSLGVADEDVLKRTLIDMRTNPAAGGLPQRAAMLFDNLGEKAYGNVTAELLNSLKWCTDPAMRVQLSRSDFQFADFVHGKPRTVYITVSFKGLIEQARWLRTLTELTMLIAQRERERNPRPSPPLLMILDELPQYGRQLEGLKEGLVTLRDAGVRMWAYVQNHQQLVECFGAEGAKNFESGGTVQVFGINDIKTATWVADKLGRHRIKHKQWKRWKWLFFRRTVGRQETHLVDPAIVAQQLQNSQNLQYVFPADGAPMRLERLAFKRLKIGKTRFRAAPGLPPADEHLRP